MIYVVAGIKRSGSTAMFNIVRIILERKGGVNIQGQDYNIKGETLIKIHPYDEALADKADFIFLTDRDDNGIRESLHRFNGKEPIEGRISRMRTHLDAWKRHPHLLLDFDLLTSDIKEYIRQIAGFMGEGVDIDLVYKEFKAIKPPEIGQDKRTLLFHNHITNDNS